MPKENSDYQEGMKYIRKGKYADNTNLFFSYLKKYTHQYLKQKLKHYPEFYNIWNVCQLEHKGQCCGGVNEPIVWQRFYILCKVVQYKL